MLDTDTDTDDDRRVRAPHRQLSWAARVRQLRGWVDTGIKGLDYAGQEAVTVGEQLEKAARAARKIKDDVDREYLNDEDTDDFPPISSTQFRRAPAFNTQPVRVPVQQSQPKKPIPTLNKGTFLDVVNRYLDSRDFETALRVTSALVDTVMHDVKELKYRRQQLLGPFATTVDVRDVSFRDPGEAAVWNARPTGNSTRQEISEHDADWLSYLALASGQQMKLAYKALRGIKRAISNKVSGAPSSVNKAVETLEDNFDEAEEIVRVLAGEEAKQRRAKIFEARLRKWVAQRWPQWSPSKVENELEVARHKLLLCDDLKGLQSDTVVGQVALYNLFTIIDRSFEEYEKFARKISSLDAPAGTSSVLPPRNPGRQTHHLLVQTGVLTDED